MSLNPNEPSETGELNLTVPGRAVSRQSNAVAKRAVCSLVRGITSPLQYIFDDEVAVDIQWMLHERFRWESDRSADVDNIVKPLLDALCGPEGILVDDCQVRSLSSTWMSWDREDEQIVIRITYHPHRFLMKAGLVFVRIRDALCYPVPMEIRERGALPTWLAALKTGLDARKELELLSDSYYPARFVVPRGYFHRSRLKGFPVYTSEELLRLKENP